LIRRTTSAIVLPLVYLIYTKVHLTGIWIFPLTMVFLGEGFVAGIEIKKPNLAGRIV